MLARISWSLKERKGALRAARTAAAGHAALAVPGYTCTWVPQHWQVRPPTTSERDPPLDFPFPAFRAQYDLATLGQCQYKSRGPELSTTVPGFRSRDLRFVPLYTCTALRGMRTTGRLLRHSHYGAGSPKNGVPERSSAEKDVIHCQAVKSTMYRASVRYVEIHSKNRTNPALPWGVKKKCAEKASRSSNFKLW
eukprot:483676-Rhodomonas_salina.1